jgi:signal transduction histidine kinase
MDAVPILVALGGILVGVASLALLRRERVRVRTQAREGARREDEFQRERAAADDARRSADLVLSSMEDGVLLFGPDGGTRLSNPAVEAQLGVRPASMEALLPLGLRHLAERAATAQAVLAVEVETGSPARTLRGFAAPAREGSVVLVIRDITETRRLDRVRRDFVANASHELKTPAATIQASAETLRQAAEDDPEAVLHFASQLEREAVRLSRIVADLLDLSRLESGSSLDDLVSLATTVRDEVQRLEESAERAEVTLEVLTGDARPVRGSQRDLALLVRNLVDNAIRYSHQGGLVKVEVGGEGDEVVLHVSDSGIGIPMRDIPRIFERFYRVDRARSRETGGTGLGLAIVKHVAENLDGKIEVESELQLGTTFRIAFPSAPSPDAPG